MVAEQTVTVTDAFGAVLDSREVKAFDTGEYLVWKVSGHVIIRITGGSAGGHLSLMLGTASDEGNAKDGDPVAELRGGLLHQVADRIGRVLRDRRAPHHVRAALLRRELDEARSGPQELVRDGEERRR